ncbi:glucuronosyl-N-acetylglucosaminyl-proteoglycan 4-alpha-N-acetylglucosaminyltransferase [Aureococcus anophagefferens]|nr:glucuronosyl-N-acetylglucosaminyl-proteoglycan 4-alpha-N-acetylglucosaminyltransferase [Aureococcus anophagefferens]
MRLLALLALVAHAAARPRGYWRAVAQELRNYCECRCRVSRRAMVDYAKAPGRLTVVVMAYLPEQNGRLNKLVCSYASEMIRKVLLLWNGPHDNVPNTTCARGWRSQQEGFHYASLTSPKREGRRGPEAELEVVVERKNTLLNRYRHGRRCATEAVLLQDDDIFHHRETLEAFSWMHAAAPAQVLGTYPERDWQVNAETGEYAYVFHPQKTKSKQYSFLLGQTSVVGRDTLSDFLSGAPRQALAYIVSHKPTCEDLTLHYFNSNRSGLPPVVFSDLKPDQIMGARGHQMHTSVSRRAWNKRRERCLNRLAADFSRMPLVKRAASAATSRACSRRALASGLWKHERRRAGPRRRDVDPGRPEGPAGIALLGDG